MDLKERIESDLAHHAPTPAKQEKHEGVRAAAMAMAVIVVTLAPAGREQSLALTKLEEAMFWANAAIARGE